MPEFASRPIEGWVELELLGHRVKYGLLSIDYLAVDGTAPILRLEEPAVPGRGAVTSFYTPQAVYGIHPSTEAAVVDELTPECREQIRDDAGQLRGFCHAKRGHEGAHDDGLEDLPF